MTSATITGWVPATPTTYARPVQDESATLGLTGCATPDGHGVLVWNVSGAVHYARVTSPAQFLVDDVVPTGDIATLMTAGTVYGSVVFSDGVDLFCVVGSNRSNVFYCEIYKANNANNPTSWSVLSTPYTNHAGGSAFGIGGGQCPPLILNSGRWVLGTKTSDGPTDDTFHAWWVRIFTSDDSGVTWTQRMEFDHVNIFPRTEYAATQMARDPVTGYLWWRSGTSISATDQNNLWRSTDNGLTWAKSTSENPANRFHPAIDNGVNIYGLDTDGDILVYDGSGFTFGDWTDTGENWSASGATLDGSFEHTTHSTVTIQGVYFFVRDQVMFVARRNLWTVGRVLIGDRSHPWR